jgi:hypothetical protein
MAAMPIRLTAKCFPALLYIKAKANAELPKFFTPNAI